ncbi:heme-binding protein [Streptomyces sp. NPDC002588]|uniref:heme-binding protein n=1 Tax=Streptomyces sp. NPDC002588 TaxID=3154419 RepID=UPI0033194F8A
MSDTVTTEHLGERAALSLAAADFTDIPGGLPVLKNGQTLGAIAVAGSTPRNDITLTEAGLAALDPT